MFSCDEYVVLVRHGEIDFFSFCEAEAAHDIIVKVDAETIVREVDDFLFDSERSCA